MIIESTIATLKPFDQVVRESLTAVYSDRKDWIKIYHPLFMDQDGSIRTPAYLLEHTGSRKGYVGFFTDYIKINFNRQVTICPKYNRNGSLNRHQCLVLGVRSGKPVFTAYDYWFERFEQIYKVPKQPMGVDITRQSWDDLFKV